MFVTPNKKKKGRSWQWSYGNLIYKYVWNQWLSPKVVNSNPAHGEVYSIQHYVIKFVIHLQQVSGFFRFPPPIKLTSMIYLKYWWKWR